jgi:peptide chain release factor 1
VLESFKHEVGAHRWHRIPPTETRGRVHTSVVTVALLEDIQYKSIEIPQHEIKIETTRGTGNGGQHKNSTDSCVIMTHISTGIKVVRDGRSQLTNREDAYQEIRKRVNEFYRTGFLGDESTVRKDQIGSGERSDKRRTYRVKDNLVVDHITGKTMTIKDLFKGKINLLS